MRTPNEVLQKSTELGREIRPLTNVFGRRCPEPVAQFLVREHTLDRSPERLGIARTDHDCRHIRAHVILDRGHIRGDDRAPAAKFSSSTVCPELNLTSRKGMT